MKIRRNGPFVALLVFWLLAGQTVAAHDYLLTWAPSTYGLQRQATNWNGLGDSYYFVATMAWNTTARSRMLHMATHGHRFTHDTRDLNDNVGATGRYSSQLTDPYYDADNDGGSVAKEEAEVTAQSAAFPHAASYTFVSKIEFSHWYQTCGSVCAWRFDGGGGSVRQTAQISRQVCYPAPGCDKWDASPELDDVIMGSTAYPSATADSAAATEIVGNSEGARSPRSGIGRVAAGYNTKRGSSADEVVLVPDLSQGLEEYRGRAKKAAHELAAKGPSRGIVTFAKPLTMADLQELASGGMIVESVEAVTTDHNGPRWSIGGPIAPDMEAWLRSEAAAGNEDVRGITSARVIVDEEALEAIADDARVYVVDLSIEHFGRRNPGASDVVMNDLYWTHAGWNE